MTYASDVLADSPVDFYQMETSTGTDSGSGSRTITLNGGITTGVAGNVGNGWSFDGVNDYASFATFPSLTTAFTFEAWVKPNLSGVNDTPTVIRKDGTDIVLLRVRGSALGVNPGQAEVYIDGTTLLSTSSYRVDDGNWHHLVYTQSGSAAKLYVDGVERASATTSQSTFVFGTSTGGTIGSANGSSEWYKGVLDNVAVYNTALSPTRIGVHYTSGQITHGGYTAQASTASALAVNPTVVASHPGGYTAQVMTASATTVAGTEGYGQTALASTGDAELFSTTNIQDDSMDFNHTSTSYAAIKFGVPSGFTDASIRKATLRVYVNSVGGTGVTFTVAKITNNWNPASDIASSLTLGSVVTTPVVTSGWNNFDVTSLVTVSGFYGFAVHQSASAVNPGAIASESSANSPKLLVDFVATSSAASVAGGPLTASAAMPDPTVATTAGVSASGQPLTAAATLVDPVVAVVSNVSITAEPAQASALMTSSGFAVPATAYAPVLTAAATTVDATVTTQRGPRIEAGVATAVARWNQPSAVNGAAIIANEAEDKYFQRVMSLSPKIWYRLNDHGSIADDRIGALNGTYSGVLVGQNNGPENRASVYFNGSALIAQTEPEGSNVDEATDYDATGVPKTTLDFSFRTVKENTFLMAGKDNFRNPVTNTVSQGSPREVFLKNGKIVYKTYNWNFQNGTYTIGEFNGFKNLADGEWHSVSIRSNVTRFGELGIEFWIDGKMDVRRVVTGQPAAFAGFPDYIGGRPDSIDGFNIGVLPGSQWFEGDMSEVVFYDHHNSEHQTTRLYYDFMGWNPVEANPVEAFAFMTDGNRGKGNQKRALFLFWDAAQDFYQVGGGSGNNKPSTNPVLAAEGNEGIYDLSGYKVFSRSVTDHPLGTPYRDRVTDQRTFIDLDYDVDINDYDVIMFGDWPDEGAETDFYDSYAPGMRERLTRQLLDANDKGVGLFVTHPRLAVDLGIVDRVEWVPTLREFKGVSSQGNALGLYDYGSAVKFPWNIANDSGLEGWGGAGSRFNGIPMDTSPSFLANKAYFYGDTNKNDRFRVRALIEGLTDIPSYMIKDAIYQSDFSGWGWQGQAFKYLHREGGLQIGDEYIFHGSDFGLDKTGVSADYDVIRSGRWLGTWATPTANVKAGTVVTTFGAKQWVEKEEVDNPYKDYATTIVLRPGDQLGGRVIKGRIYVNYSEQPNRAEEAVAVQVLPAEGEPFPSNYRAPDTAAQREWEWSFTRQSLTSTSQVGTQNVLVTMPDGSTQTIVVTGGGSGETLSMSRSSNIFPIEWKLSWQMNRRGLWWLSQDVEVSEGDRSVVSNAMTATATMPTPTVVAQRDAVATAQPMRALAEVRKVAEDHTGNADVYTLPMTAEATFTGFSKVISATPMTATAEFVENFDVVHATGEQVVLTLHGVDATLYLKEEA